MSKDYAIYMSLCSTIIFQLINREEMYVVSCSNACDSIQLFRNKNLEVPQPWNILQILLSNMQLADKSLFVKQVAI